MTPSDDSAAAKRELSEALEKALAAIKPFADAVYNDNGDMTISSVTEAEPYRRAYFAARSIDKALASKPSPDPALSEALEKLIALDAKRTKGPWQEATVTTDIIAASMSGRTGRFQTLYWVEGEDDYVRWRNPIDRAFIVALENYFNLIRERLEGEER